MREEKEGGVPPLKVSIVPVIIPGYWFGSGVLCDSLVTGKLAAAAFAP